MTVCREKPWVRWLGGHHSCSGPSRKCQNHGSEVVYPLDTSYWMLHPISVSCLGFLAPPWTPFWSPSGQFTVIYHGHFLGSSQRCSKGLENWCQGLQKDRRRTVAVHHLGFWEAVQLGFWGTPNPGPVLGSAHPASRIQAEHGCSETPFWYWRCASFGLARPIYRGGTSKNVNFLGKMAKTCPEPMRDGAGYFRVHHCCNPCSG